MKILQVHNKYKKRGGEETVLEEERRILQSNDHEVIQFIKDSQETEGYSLAAKVRLVLSQRASSQVANELKALIQKEKPDLCHVHNVYPLITPVVFEVCAQLGLPVVHTLHNYKMVCTNSLLFKEGKPCELCLNKSLYQSINQKCYRESYLATALQADTIQFHRKKGTWQEKVDQYVCLTEFQRDKLISGGLPGHKMVIKPNFVHALEVDSEQGDFFLFVGRLDASKGLADLLGLFKVNQDSKFILIGTSDDPSIFEPYGNVTFMGSQSRDVVIDYMKRCRAVLFPSHYYEGMPMVILEAFALSKPVIAHDVGAMSSMISQNENGLKYKNLEGLVADVKRLDTYPEDAAGLGVGAYKEYQKKYTTEAGYNNLMQLYNNLLKAKNAV